MPHHATCNTHRRAAQTDKLVAAVADAVSCARAAGLGSFFLESTFIDQNNPKRQTAGPQWGSPKLDLRGSVAARVDAEPAQGSKGHT